MEKILILGEVLIVTYPSPVTVYINLLWAASSLNPGMFDIFSCFLPSNSDIYQQIQQNVNPITRVLLSSYSLRNLLESSSPVFVHPTFLKQLSVLLSYQALTADAPVPFVLENVLVQQCVVMQ